jgi:hypothetical protein
MDEVQWHGSIGQLFTLEQLHNPFILGPMAHGTWYKAHGTLIYVKMIKLNLT